MIACRAFADENHRLLAPPTLAAIWPTNNNVGVSGFCHGLLFYKLGPTDLSSCSSGQVMLKALTDEKSAIGAFGESPFVRTRNGLRYFLSEDPVYHSRTGETHRDQCLATFGALNLPLDTPIHLKSAEYSISNLLSESIANFTFDQHEPAWTAMAYAKYLAPQRQWVNRYGERTSFSQMANYLLKLNLNEQSCAGTHILQALVKIDLADRHHEILDPDMRAQLDRYLIAMLGQTARHQQADGSWDWRWAEAINKEPGEVVPGFNRLLVTGHLLEILHSLDSERHVAGVDYKKAAEWLSASLRRPEMANVAYLCPFTHAAQVSAEILSHSEVKKTEVAGDFHHASNVVDVRKQ